jgi:hypothetical protein
MIARIVGVLAALVCGGAAQITLWRKPGGTSFDALTQYPYLWIAYALIGLLVGEHCLRIIKRRRQVPNKQGRTS